MDVELRRLAEQVLADLSPRYQPHIGYDDLPPKAMRVARLAEGVLVVNPADSDELITEDWLRRYQHKDDSGSMLFVIDVDRMVYLCVETDMSWGIQQSLFNDLEGDYISTGKVIETRGDFYSLCRALGIELKEKP